MGFVVVLQLLRLDLNLRELTGLRVSPSTVLANPKSATTAVKSYRNTNKFVVCF